MNFWSENENNLFQPCYLLVYVILFSNRLVRVLLLRRFELLQRFLYYNLAVIRVGNTGHAVFTWTKLDIKY